MPTGRPVYDAVYFGTIKSVATIVFPKGGTRTDAKSSTCLTPHLRRRKQLHASTTFMHYKHFRTYNKFIISHTHHIQYNTN